MAYAVYLLPYKFPLPITIFNGSKQVRVIFFYRESLIKLINGDCRPITLKPGQYSVKAAANYCLYEKEDEGILVMCGTYTSLNGFMKK